MSGNSSSSRVRRPSLFIIIKTDLCIDMNQTPPTPPGTVTGGGGSWSWGYNRPQPIDIPASIDVE